MRILNIHGAGDVRLDPKAAPEIGSDDVVVKVMACGICGSDLAYIKWGGVNRPEGGVTPLGHEAAGEVAAVGASVRGVSVGQRVVINPMATTSVIGNGGPEGAFSEEVLVKNARLGASLLPIPDDLPFDVAALAEPLAVALHGVNRAQLKEGEKVVVFGCGPIGLGMVLWLLDRGINDVVALDLAPERLDRAKSLGARAVINPAREDVFQRLKELHGEGSALGEVRAGTDVYLDAAGGSNIVNDVIRMAKLHARMVITAAYSTPLQVNLGHILASELSITGACGYPDEFSGVVASLPRLMEKASGLISHRYPLEEILHALTVASTPQSAKVMITMGQPS